MSRVKYSDEFKEQGRGEVIEKNWLIASVAASCDLVPQTVGSRATGDRSVASDAEKAP